MATEVWQFTATVPAGTPSSAPYVKAFTMPRRIVDTIQIVVPAGPSGLVGFAVTASGLTVIPYNSDPWIITSGENITWPVEEQIDSGAWGVRAYNTGTLDHSIYFRFLVRPVTNALGMKPAMIPEGDLVPPSDIALGA
jgi:hypothetical protein